MGNEVNDGKAEKGTGDPIHGSGYVTGMTEMVYISRRIHLVEQYGATVISPAYRLSRKAPYPAALLNCYHVLLYMKKHVGELGIRDGNK